MTPLYIHDDNLIELTGLRKASDDSYVNDAEVTFTVKTSANVAVTGATAVTMSYVADSDGNYQGTLDSTVSLTVGETYYLEVTITSGELDGFRRIPCIARYHENE